jgi:L,D-transpeptidase catalytic domain
MKQLLPALLTLAGLALLAGCATGPVASSSYHVTAYKPHNPANVVVKLSTSTQHLYVMEGSRCLMAVQGCVGEPGHSTPQGHFHIEAKIRDKRSGTYGFTSDGRGADAHEGGNVAVGYPMAFWCEFQPGYGFHQGYVWPIPRTHGCVRLHKEAAARLFALVHVGTPVDIASSQPEDATIGKTVQRLDQRNDPDPPASRLMSPSWFQDPAGPLLTEQ